MSEILKLKNIKKYFPVKSNILFETKKYIYAVNDVSFSINYGETVGLVGESGCGKSTIARIILRLINPCSGEIIFDNENITNIRFNKLINIRKKMQIIFQDPYSSLNPRKTVLDIISAPLITHKVVNNKKELENKVIELMNSVGLSKDYLHHYPMEFSGGQRQRIGIARAIALNPKLIICDEPVSALDVSVQAQIINLLMNLKKNHNLSYLFISHDLSVIKHISDKILVMYLGKIVEYGEKQKIFSQPLHPYTKALISAIPEPSIDNKKTRIILKGDIETPNFINKCCIFSKRCFISKEICFQKEPEYKKINDNHYVMCHFV